MAPLLQQDFPAIKKITRLLDNSPAPLKYGDKLFNEPNVFFADENIFDVFDVNLIKGDPKKALNDPFTVMLTEEAAQKYFGKEDAIDKLIKLDNRFDLRVTAVYKAFPANAHVHPGMMIHLVR
ncbi:MAG: ABC transporter permease [Ferruginibacter sp.]